MAANDLKRAEKIVISASKKISATRYSRPINVESEKEKFLNNKTTDPSFEYKEPEYDTKKVNLELNKINIPDSEIGKLYKRKCKSLLLQNKIIENIGKNNKIKKLSSEVYGKPNSDLVKYADSLLKKLSPHESRKELESFYVKKKFEDVLNELGLNNWKVVFSNERETSVYPDHKKITICRNRKFSYTELKQLLLHEIYVHALRSENGYTQPYLIFAFGLSGYLSTEEGLTTYFEKKTGIMDDNKLRDYAGRVIAVDSVCKNLTFDQTFRKLKEYGFSDDVSWILSSRAHRAGGFIKDHIYLDGYVKVKEFSKKDGDFKDLFVGKVGLNDLKLVRKLIEKGTIKPPSHVPDFIQGCN